MFYTKPYADLLIVLLIVLLFFGPKRLPALGKSLGQGFREFKDSITGASKNDESAERPELEAASPNPAPAPQATPTASVAASTEQPAAKSGPES
jgi:sec-independent protein translocase protein TatA